MASPTTYRSSPLADAVAAVEDAAADPRLDEPARQAAALAAAAALLDEMEGHGRMVCRDLPDADLIALASIVRVVSGEGARALVLRTLAAASPRTVRGLEVVANAAVGAIPPRPPVAGR